MSLYEGPSILCKPQQNHSSSSSSSKNISSSSSLLLSPILNALSSIFRVLKLRHRSRGDLGLSKQRSHKMVLLKRPTIIKETRSLLTLDDRFLTLLELNFMNDGRFNNQTFPLRPNFRSVFYVFPLQYVHYSTNSVQMFCL